ncbi:MAG TPA: PAS domain S-box protein [Verrucomicrobiae bacterium]|nr:PAS domain S-box protein [Verrucomicrobiae bacterium]
MRDRPAQMSLEERLRASEELFSKAFHTSPDPTAITRRSDSMILEANDAFARKYGIPLAEVRGRTALELGVWQSKEERNEVMCKLDAAGFLRNYEKRNILPTGELNVGLLTIEPLTIQGEECLLTISHDITREVEAVRALRESEERYRNFIALSAEGIARCDLDPPIALTLPVAEQVRAIIERGLVAECNDTAAQMRGWPNADAMQGKRIAELMETSDPTNRLNLAAFAESGYKAVDVVTHGRDAKGSDVFFLNNAVGIVRDGYLRHIWTVQRNITKQMLAENALRASEERFELAVRGSNDGIWDWDVRTGEVYYAARVRELLGYSSPAEFPPVLVTFFDHLHPNDRNRIQAALDEHLKNRTPYDVECRLCTRFGHYRWFRVRGQAVWNSDGKPIRMAGSISDIHDHKVAEESLRLAQAETLAATEEFSRRLISAQEQERKRLANELHDSLGQNLSLIKNRAHLAIQQPDIPASQQGHLQAITDVVTEAINETRNLAQNLRPLHIDQFGLTDALGSLAEKTAASSSLRIETRLEKVDDLFGGEEATNVYRIIQELLNNTLRHAHATGATIAVERDVNCVRIRVQDNGKGFDPGSVAKARRIRTGIGLNSIAERTRMLGGSFQIKSAPAQGTRVEIELPLSRHAPS